jgi:hypothetical protein
VWTVSLKHSQFADQNLKRLKQQTLANWQACSQLHDIQTHLPIGSPVHSFMTSKHTCQLARLFTAS